MRSTCPIPNSAGRWRTGSRSVVRGRAGIAVDGHGLTASLEVAKKIAKNKRCYANTLRPRSRMLLKVMKGVRGVVTRWVIFIPWVNLSVTGNGGPCQR